MAERLADMKLSESIRRGILKTDSGSIVNRFHVKSRRDVLFFENILAEYVRECEKAGYEKEMKEIGRKWMCFTINSLLPRALKKIPIEIIFNRIGRNIWINLGLMNDIRIEKNGRELSVITANEYVTRIIGRNCFITGQWEAALMMYYDSAISEEKNEQTKSRSVYRFRLSEKMKIDIPSRDKKLYMKLNNASKGRGLTLERFIKSGLLKLKPGNRLYFRNKPMVLIENTLFHLFSNSGILMDSVPGITSGVFADIIDASAPLEKKLQLLKNILQMCGWGVVKIVCSDNGKTNGQFAAVVVSISNQPYGMQSERDDWTFLANFILGYMRLIDKGTRILSIEESPKRLEIKYTSKRQP